jgi:hypothetical protein
MYLKLALLAALLVCNVYGVSGNLGTFSHEDGTVRIDLEQRFLHGDVLRVKILNCSFKNFFFRQNNHSALQNSANPYVFFPKTIQSSWRLHIKVSTNQYQQWTEFVLDDFVLLSVSFGTPVQGPFTVLLSTGQTFAWIYGKDMGNVDPSQHHFYHPE